MRPTLYSVCVAALAVSLTTVFAEDDSPHAKSKPAGGSARVQNSARSSGGVKSSARIHQSAAATRSNWKVPNTVSGPNHSNHVSRNYSNVNTGSNVTVNRSRSNFATNRGQNFTARNTVVSRDRNSSTRNQAYSTSRNQVYANRGRNAVVTNNWSGSRFAGSRYAAFRNYRRISHDRYWWDSHYPRITFYFGAPYYWNAGYWYPAWGYYPGYNYVYDGPIYGYNGLAPDQVVMDVQAQLQRDGYYSGPIDGVLGPMTRAAIASFQADRGLAITSAIDEPTLATLGIS